MKTLRLTPALLIVASLVPSHAKADSDILVYAVGGTGGIGGGIGYHFNDYFTARAEIASYSKSIDNVTAGDLELEYTATAKLETKALFVDYKPFAGSFRITAGVNASAHTVAELSNIADPTIPVAAGDATAKATYGTRPYLGVGWGLSRKGFTMGLDLGVEFGKATVTLTDNTGAFTPAEVQAEQEALQRELDNFDLWPIVKISVGYSF